jgi:hypothetical protein
MDILIQLWQVYPFLVDLALYFFVFAATARVSLVKVFPGREGKTLAVAVGLFLAASLTMAQSKLGFSLEDFGAAAAFLLCAIVFLASYKFMHYAEIPMHLTVLLSGLLTLTLLRTTMPTLTERFLENNPIVLVVGMAGLLLWAWRGSEALATRFTGRIPGSALEKHKVIPNSEDIGKARRFVQKRLRSQTKKEMRDERFIENNLEHALRIINREGVSAANKQALLNFTDEALARTAKVKEVSRRLQQLDEAIRRFDLGWLKSNHNVRFGQLTPGQQRIVRKSIHAERNRLGVEAMLKELENRIHSGCEQTAGHIMHAKGCLQDGNAVGASGWLALALRADKELGKLDKEVLAMEKKLLKLLKHQRRSILKDETN